MTVSKSKVLLPTLLSITSIDLLHSVLSGVKHVTVPHIDTHAPLALLNYAWVNLHGLLAMPMHYLATGICTDLVK